MRPDDIIKNNSGQKGIKLLSLSAFALGLLLTFGCGKQVETARKAETRTNEAAAIRALQNIFRAQTQYAVTHSNDYGTFDELIKEGYLDQRFAGHSPVIEGYVFTILTVPDQDSSPGTFFFVNADPKDAASAATRHLYIDSSSNVVRANAQQPARATDPPLQ